MAYFYCLINRIKLRFSNSLPCLPFHPTLCWWIGMRAIPSHSNNISLFYKNVNNVMLTINKRV